jgi:hypothetical protein
MAQSKGLLPPTSDAAELRRLSGAVKSYHYMKTSKDNGKAT